MKQTQVALKSAEGEMNSPFNADLSFQQLLFMWPYYTICIHMLYFHRSPTEVPVAKKNMFPAAGGANIWVGILPVTVI